MQPPRAKLTAAQGQRLEPLLPGKATDPGRAGFDNRKTMEGNPLDCPYRRAVARPAALLWQVERHSPAFPPVG